MSLSQSRRKLEVVSTKAKMKTGILWMMNEVEQRGSEDRIAARAETQFPQIFTQ